MAAGAVTLIRRVVRRMRDFPESVYMPTGALAADAADTSITLDTGEGARVEAGMVLETDDLEANGNAEPMLVRSVNGDTITVRRAYQNTTLLLPHTAPMYLRIEPRFFYPRINDALLDVGQNYLWPDVWIPLKTTLAFQSASEYYAPSVSDIVEIDYAYQLANGRREPLHTEFISKAVADAGNFPGGAVIIRHTVDESTIYLAYRAYPVIFGGANTNQIDNLLVMGASALLQEEEEIPHQAPGRSAIEQKLPTGSKFNAGRGLMGQFYEARRRENVRLMAELVEGLEFRRGIG